MSMWLDELSMILEALGPCSDDEIITRPIFAALFNVNGPDASRIMKAFGGTEMGIERKVLVDAVLGMLSNAPQTNARLVEFAPTKRSRPNSIPLPR